MTPNCHSESQANPASPERTRLTSTSKDRPAFILLRACPFAALQERHRRIRIVRG
jgi:hypothetical protein